MQTQAAKLKRSISLNVGEEGAVVTAALFFLFAFLLICAGMWVVAAQTGFVGAVGPLRKPVARATALAG